MVSIICLCYNHKDYVEEALSSVFNQTYKNWELIIVDDASVDGSVEKIKHFLANYYEINNDIASRVKTIFLDKNKGNCTAFNEGFKISKGEYIIDLAADDKFENDKLEKQIKALENADSQTGVCFTNAVLIDEKSEQIGNYYYDWYKKQPKDGYIFKELVRAGGMICSPTMLIKREVLEELGGYDESLSYEDYDFWVRSARNWKYVFLSENLTFYRKINHSHSSTFKKKNNPHLYSTFKVCQKAFLLCQSNDEYKALSISVLYHFKESIKFKNYRAAKGFLKLIKKLIFKRVKFYQ
ncbi:glycosyltransferase family 2 protein [Bernardetia sp.]|uniref:glycosyltransferase family 2 protein n=1 Tax=Bernardetia sp. TaxID=1937974 RepID=UPI0025C28516|nr:glycosyltransferase [Bernardetia sp.]